MKTLTSSLSVLAFVTGALALFRIAVGWYFDKHQRVVAIPAVSETLDKRLPVARRRWVVVTLRVLAVISAAIGVYAIPHFLAPSFGVPTDGRLANPPLYSTEQYHDFFFVSASLFPLLVFFPCKNESLRSLIFGMSALFEVVVIGFVLFLALFFILLRNSNNWHM